ncbi:orotidine-5'-phosphate decarboxylase [Lignipirellula cremea]|uniref:Orotidine 5'-phosphate decarboxylase n=1 Tax=Lignipirellula cremea TaxID=2528010 RepID=A0A518DPH0_9BACT|nr:orotidine-5'-phosphate decarboxylase [Lignipirellula cremea]QDU93732.1 Orotidine 5'-phosphate decarboxylase [Lignipirellula cremea]
MHFADRLAQAVKERGTPVLVGLDPRLANLPDELRELAAADGEAAAYREFCCAVIDAVADQVAVVKPQMAFFEELGPDGLAALHAVVAYARQRDLLVILDGKRNDIGSTATAYAKAYLGASSAWQGDALTVSPYLGDDSLEPFAQEAVAQEAGVFVLVKTSNPGGKTFQDLLIDGQPLYRCVAALVEKLAAESAGECGYGAVGAVAGATWPEQLVELRQAMPHTWFLVPGFGAQGAGAVEVAGAFDEQGLGAIVNSSRGIIFAYERGPYREQFGQGRWREAIAAAARDMTAQLRQYTPAARLA